MRRLLSFLLIVAVLGVAAYTLWTWNSAATPRTDPWSAIPQQSAMVIEVPQAWRTWDRITHTTQLWGTFSKLPGAASSGTLLGSLAARMENDAALRSAIQENTVLIAVLRSGGERAGTLFIGERNEGGSLADKAFAEVLGANGSTMELLARGEVVQVRPDTALPALSLCMPPGLWLLASDPGVMDEALLNIKSGVSIASDPLLVKARSTFGAGMDANVLVHTGRFQSLLNSWWKPDALKDVDLPIGWAALDLRVLPDALLMSGLLAPDSGTTLLQALAEQGSGKSSAMRVLPARVALNNTLHISAPVAWLAHHNKSDDPRAATLFEWVQGSVGIAASPATEHGTVETWAYFETEDPEAAAIALGASCATGCDTINYRGIRLTRLPFTGAHERLLGPRFERFEKPWWIVLGDIVLFSDDARSLMSSIDVWNDGGSLAEDQRAAGWNARMSSEASATLWCDVARVWPYLAPGLRDQGHNDVADSIAAELGGFTLQLSPGQRGFHHLTIGLQHAPHAKPVSALAWSTALGANVQRAPDLVRNHVNNTREVLVQDTLNRLHLLASSGKILWTRQLDAPIMGPVTQVDRFRNGKLQMLFNSANMLYLIDRNGKDVGGFPMKLKSPASAALSVFDYDNERDYRVIVPTTDATVLNFGLDGEGVKGWERPKLPSPAAAAVTHLRIKGKDHLVVVCTDGSVHILDRRGTVRERTTLRLSEQPQYVRITPGPELFSSQVVWNDAQFQSWTSDLKGSASPQRSLSRYSTTGDSLLVNDERGTRTLRNFGSALGDHVMEHQVAGQERMLSVERPTIGLLSMLNEGGTELEGSPVRGAWSAPLVDIDLDGTLEWITITRDGIVEAHRLPTLRSTSR